METTVAYAPKILSGVDVIDEAWGGLYRGGSYLVYGRAATGRGLLTMMFVQTGAMLEERCLFISPDRPKDLMIQAASMGFNLRQAYESGLVKLMRIPPMLNLQEIGDEGVAKALNDLVSIIRQNRPDRLVINDFMPFVQFRSFDRFRAAFVQMLEQIDSLDTTMKLVMAEPANQQSRKVIDFMRNQMTGAVHIELVEDDASSTKRRLTLIPNIGHIKRRVVEFWDLQEVMEESEENVSTAQRMLPGRTREPKTAAPAEDVRDHRRFRFAGDANTQAGEEYEPTPPQHEEWTPPRNWNERRPERPGEGRPEGPYEAPQRPGDVAPTPPYQAPSPSYQAPSRTGEETFRRQQAPRGGDATRDSDVSRGGAAAQPEYGAARSDDQPIRPRRLGQTPTPAGPQEAPRANEPLVRPIPLGRRDAPVSPDVSRHEEPTQYRDEPQYRGKPQYRDEPGHRDEPQYRDDPRYRDEPAYRGEPQQRDDVEYRDHPQYRNDPAYREDSSFRSEPTYREEPLHREEPAHRAEPPYREEPAYRDDPQYRQERPRREDASRRDESFHPQEPQHRQEFRQREPHAFRRDETTYGDEPAEPQHSDESFGRHEPSQHDDPTKHTESAKHEGSAKHDGPEQYDGPAEPQEATHRDVRSEPLPETSHRPVVSSTHYERPSHTDRDAFRSRLQQHFLRRDVNDTPFLLVAMRMDRSEERAARPFDFEFILDLVSELLRDQDDMLVELDRERLIVLLADSRPEGAQQFFAQLKNRLRDEAPQQADHLLHSVSAIVVPDGRPFQNAEEFLTYALDEA